MVLSFAMEMNGIDIMKIEKVLKTIKLAVRVNKQIEMQWL